MIVILLLLGLLGQGWARHSFPASAEPSSPSGRIHLSGENYFKSIRQLTFGGSNAEAYFSFDDSKLTFQAAGGPYDPSPNTCDQIYQLDLHNPKNTPPRRISTGLGTCTCSFFLKDNKSSLYAGTFWNVKYPTNEPVGNTCPAKACDQPNKPDDLEKLCKQTHMYVWNIFEDYDIFVVNEYGHVVNRLTKNPGYDAEGVLNPAGDKILFTSKRKEAGDKFADLNLYLMDVNGTNVERITSEIGYDGGAFFSPDGKKVVFRASRPKTDAELDHYKQLLKYNMVEPSVMEIYSLDLATRNLTQVTKLGGSSWAPYYLPDNKRIIFSSNHKYIKNHDYGHFALFIVNDDGSNLKQITSDEDKFASFPMFSYDKKWLAFSSSRNASASHEINVFLAEWVDNAGSDKSTWLVLLTMFVWLTRFIFIC